MTPEPLKPAIDSWDITGPDQEGRVWMNVDNGGNELREAITKALAEETIGDGRTDTFDEMVNRLVEAVASSASPGFTMIELGKIADVRAKLLAQFGVGLT